MNRCIFILFLLGLTLSSCRTAKIKTQKNLTENISKDVEIPLTGDEEKEFLEFVSSWIGTPYLYGGKNKSGTDCSGLVFTTYKEVFGIDSPRSASDLYKVAKPLKINELRAGDLVFFDIKNGSVSHVGMYLNEKYFIHSSTKKGVIISSLDESYYKEHFKSFGSLRKN